MSDEGDGLSRFDAECEAVEHLWKGLNISYQYIGQRCEKSDQTRRTDGGRTQSAESGEESRGRGLKWADPNATHLSIPPRRVSEVDVLELDSARRIGGRLAAIGVRVDAGNLEGAWPMNGRGLFIRTWSVGVGWGE